MVAPVPVTLEGGGVVPSHLGRVPAGEPAGTGVGVRKSSPRATREPPLVVSSSVAVTCTESRNPRFPGPFWYPLFGFGTTLRFLLVGPVRSMTSVSAAAAPVMTTH